MIAMAYGLRNMIDSENPNNPEHTSAADDEALMALLRNTLSRKPEIFGDEEDEFVMALRDIASCLRLGSDVSVIYPGSSTHAGVARVFGKDHVQHVDPDEGAMDVMSAHGYKTTISTIEEYAPTEQADVMVALNSYGEPTLEVIERLVKDGGYIIANNYTRWAYSIMKTGTAELVGAVIPDYRMPTAELVEKDKIDPSATDISTSYIILEDGGAVKEGTPENHSFADERAKYPDELFVFKKIS